MIRKENFPVTWDKIWNASRFCVSSLHGGRANLLCIVPVLVQQLGLCWVAHAGSRAPEFIESSSDFRLPMLGGIRDYFSPCKPVSPETSPGCSPLVLPPLVGAALLIASNTPSKINWARSASERWGIYGERGRTQYARRSEEEETDVLLRGYFFNMDFVIFFFLFLVKYLKFRIIFCWSYPSLTWW